MAKKFAQIGSISSGTMITEDVFSACIDALTSLDRKRAKGIQASWDRVEENCSSMDEDHDTETCENCQEARSDILNNDLWNALNEFAPPYCHFGAHGGDGADYGFWPSIDSLEDDARCGEVLKVDDSSKIPDDYRGYAMVVNDHGNITLLNRSNRGNKEMWSCV